MKKLSLGLLIGLGLGLAVALGLALREFVGASIVTPVLFVAWLAGLVINSVAGWVWWAWLVIIAVVVAVRSLRTRAADAEVPPGGREPAVGPVARWAERLRMAHHRDDYFRWRLARDLADLALYYTAGRQRLGERLHRAADLAPLNAPPEIAAYWQMGLAAPPMAPARTPLQALRRGRRGRQTFTPLDLDPLKAVAFLEEHMEIAHDA